VLSRDLSDPSVSPFLETQPTQLPTTWTGRNISKIQNPKSPDETLSRRQISLIFIYFPYQTCRADSSIPNSIYHSVPSHAFPSSHLPRLCCTLQSSKRNLGVSSRSQGQDYMRTAMTAVMIRSTARRRALWKLRRRLQPKTVREPGKTLPFHLEGRALQLFTVIQEFS
jgi:hypothetical protein